MNYNFEQTDLIAFIHSSILCNDIFFDLTALFFA